MAVACPACGESLPGGRDGASLCKSCGETVPLSYEEMAANCLRGLLSFVALLAAAAALIGVLYLAMLGIGAVIDKTVGWGEPDKPAPCNRYNQSGCFEGQGSIVEPRGTFSP